MVVDYFEASVNIASNFHSKSIRYTDITCCKFLSQIVGKEHVLESGPRVWAFAPQILDQKG